MASAYKITDNSALYFLTFQIVGWVDLFTRKIYRDIAIDCFKYCQLNKGLELYAYVIMSNHIHLLARSANEDLSGFVRDYKSFTSKQFQAVLDEGRESRSDWMRMVFEYHAKYKREQTNQVWTNDNHAELIYSEKFISQKINYIHSNPVSAGIVSQPEDYTYSSARNYAGLESVIDVIIADLV